MFEKYVAFGVHYVAIYITYFEIGSNVNFITMFNDTGTGKQSDVRLAPP